LHCGGHKDEDDIVNESVVIITGMSGRAANSVIWFG